MIDAELLAELRNWVEAFGLSKLEVSLAFVVGLVFFRLRTILDYFNARHAINKNFELKNRQLQAKIAKERKRRERST